MISNCPRPTVSLTRLKTTRLLTGACTLAMVFPHAQPLASAQARAAFTLDVAHPDWIAPESFTAFGGIRVLSNGSAIVVDVKEITVRLLGANGQTIRNIGRKGSGPGEYTMPAAIIALPADTTLVLDRDARRYILLGPTGKIVETRTFPTELADGATAISAADDKGNLYFQVDAPVVNGVPTRAAPIARWRRNATRFDTVAQLNLNLAVSKALSVPLPDNPDAKFRAIERPRFGSNDNWLAARSGRVVIIHAEPYRVEWVERDGRRTMGKTQAYSPIPVSIADKKYTEPNGPPFHRAYAVTMAPFVDGSAVVDDGDNVWVQRSAGALDAEHRWDIFDAKANDAVLRKPASDVIVANIGDSSINLVLRAWIKTESFAQTRSELTEAVHRSLTDAGISMPYPQRDVHVYHHQAKDAGVDQVNDDVIDKAAAAASD